MEEKLNMGTQYQTSGVITLKNLLIYPNLECVNLNIVWITDSPGLASPDFATFLVSKAVFLKIQVCLIITL